MFIVYVVIEDRRERKKEKKKIEKERIF